MMNNSAEFVQDYLTLLTIINNILYLKSVELRLVGVRVSPWALPSVDTHILLGLLLLLSMLFPHIFPHKL